MKMGFILVSLVFGLIFAHAQDDVDVEEAMMVISKNAFKSHIRFLADDLLEGRDTGSRGYELAARYVASQFEAYGLRPAIGDSSYFQEVPLRIYAPDQQRGNLVLYVTDKKIVFVLEKDFITLGNSNATVDSLDTEVVFAGYGISAPVFGHDDYASINAGGKIVAIMQGIPDNISGSARAHLNSWSVKRQTAIDNGAIGMLYLRSREQDKQFSWERTTKFKYEATTWLDDQGNPRDDVGPFKARAVLSSAATDSLLGFAGLDPDTLLSGKYGSVELPVKAMISAYSLHSDNKCHNVAAWLPGSDPELKDEFVIYTAHLDHVGIGRPVNGDSIYNGAYDNASGVSALLETAHMYAQLNPRPKRSVMFVAVTAEEKGLIGSDYFVNNSPVPLYNIAANVNLDMFLMLFPQNDVVAFGSEHSSLHDIVREAVEEIGMTLTPDPMPEENLFVRSDQYSFVKKGIPAVFLFSGVTSTDPDVDGLQLNKDWLKTFYHKPSDDIGQPMDLEIAVKFCRANFLIGYHVAQGDHRPEWNEGDFFANEFAQRRDE